MDRNVEKNNDFIKSLENSPTAESIDKVSQALRDAELNNTNTVMTNSNGVPVRTDLNLLKAGYTGPSLLEDFLHLDKMQHFDRERIPERVVHARGVGAHGYFECTNPASDVTCAKLFQEKGKRVPVFARLSTVIGNRGSSDLARDVRGFSVKHYTEEGNWDFVGNNIPVFFIQDALRFPDLIHAAKPEPMTEIPQAATAHDTFWDFVSLSPESAHMAVWIMSDRSIPRALDQMEGFSIHTFRFINQQGEACYVRFTYKPVKGAHSVVWDEAQSISGHNPDYHRQELYDTIDKGETLEWILYAQIIEEMPIDEMIKKFGFDLNDPTKFLPIELVPLRELGRLVLNKNVSNFFAETEQAVFHPGNIIPGIDFSEDPLLQGRIFSYSDAQMHRIGPNRNQLPINAPKCPVFNNQQDGKMQFEIKTQEALYHPTSVQKECPFPINDSRQSNWEFAQGKFSHTTDIPEKPKKTGSCPFLQGFMSGDAMIAMNGPVSNNPFYRFANFHGKTRERSPTFSDHFSHASLFYRSQSPWEQAHIISAFSFELNQVKREGVKERMVNKILYNIDAGLAQEVAQRVGVELNPEPVNNPYIKKLGLGARVTKLPEVSFENQIIVTKGKKCAIISSNQYNAGILNDLINELKIRGIGFEIISAIAGNLTSSTQSSESATPHSIKVDKPLPNAAPVFYDFLCIIDCTKETNECLGANIFVQTFITAHFNHGKHICDLTENNMIFQSTGLQPSINDGLFTQETKQQFIDSLEKVDRYHSRQLQTRLGFSTDTHL